MTFVFVVGGVVAGLVALMVLSRTLIVWKAKAQQGKPAPELSGPAKAWVRKGKRALFYFYSPACGACHAMTPVVQRLRKDHDGVFPVDVSQDMETARRFGVMATPTTVVVDHGVVARVLIGPQTPAALQGLVAS